MARTDRPRAATLEASLKEAVKAMERLKQSAPPLIAMAHDFERGFPAGSLGGGAGGEAHPTENQAIARIPYKDEDGRWHPAPPDPAAEIDDFLKALNFTISSVLALDGKCQALQPKGETEEDEKTASGVFCVNCAKHGVQKAADKGRAGRCENCWRYRYDHNLDDRPRELVLAEDERKRQRAS